MPSNDVGVLWIRYSISVKGQLFRKYRCSGADTATNGWLGRTNIEMCGTDAPNLCFG